jgi:hypothetical protein
MVEFLECVHKLGKVLDCQVPAKRFPDQTVAKYCLNLSFIEVLTPSKQLKMFNKSRVICTEACGLQKIHDVTAPENVRVILKAWTQKF